ASPKLGGVGRLSRSLSASTAIVGVFGAAGAGLALGAGCCARPFVTPAMRAPLRARPLPASADQLPTSAPVSVVPVSSGGEVGASLTGSLSGVDSAARSEEHTSELQSRE